MHRAPPISPWNFPTMLFALQGYKIHVRPIQLLVKSFLKSFSIFALIVPTVFVPVHRLKCTHYLFLTFDRQSRLGEEFGQIAKSISWAISSPRSVVWRQRARGRHLMEYWAWAHFTQLLVERKKLEVSVMIMAGFCHFLKMTEFKSWGQYRWQSTPLPACLSVCTHTHA